MTLGRESNVTIGTMQRSPSISPSSRISPTSRRKRTNSGGGRTIELGGLATALVSVFIVFLGFALSQVCIFFLDPKCASTEIHSFNGTTILGSSKQIAIHEWVLGARTKITIPNRPTTKLSNTTTPVEEFPFAAKFPPKCTKDQLAALEQQLPAERCIEFQKTPWKKKAACSFSNSTKCGNSNPHWLYEFHHHEKNFKGILVGCNKGYHAIKLLHRLSHKPYDVNEWMEEFSKTNGTIDPKLECPVSEPRSLGSVGKNIQIYCIDGAANTISRLEDTKTALGYGDDLKIVHAIVGEKHVEDGLAVKITDPVGYTRSGHVHWANECKKKPKECGVAPATSIDMIVNSEAGLKTDTLINYLSISAEGSDYQILKGAARNLHRIEYIDFGYNWHGLWQTQDLEDLIFRLKKKGFVCYFTNPNKLWRITDCWQDHYKLKYKASVGCVNVNIPQAEALFHKMEDHFLKTLETATI